MREVDHLITRIRESKRARVWILIQRAILVLSVSKRERLSITNTLIHLAANFVVNGGLMNKLVIEIDVPNELDKNKVLAFTEIAVSQLRSDLDLSDGITITIKEGK